MSDFGTDVGNAGLSTMTKVAGKVMDALIALINKLFETWKQRSSADYKLKKIELKRAGVKEAERKALEKIDGKTGYIAKEELDKAKYPYEVIQSKCSEEQFHRVCELCKRSGIIISGTESVRDKELAGQKYFFPLLASKDRAIFKEICDTVLIENQIAHCSEQKAGILEKGEENLTDEDRLTIKIYDEKIQNLREGRSELLNQRQQTAEIDRAFGGKEYNGIPFSQAVDRWTGGDIDRDTTAYIVDAKNPNSYVVATARNDTFRNDNYIKTTYDVYRNDEKVLTVDDGRFEGRPKDYWMNKKIAMQEAGSMSDTVIKFYSRTEFEKYRAEFKEQYKSELEVLRQGADGRDYDQIQTILADKIKECGGEYRDGVVYDVKTNEPMKVAGCMDERTKATYAEAVVCGKQIDNYKALAAAESELAVAKVNVMVTKEGTPKNAEAIKEQTAAQVKYDAALAVESSLIDERKGVNFVQSVQETKATPAIEYSVGDKAKISELEVRIGGMEKTPVEGQKIKLADMRAELEQTKTQAAERAVRTAKNARADEKTDERRGDRADEIGDTRLTLAEYREQIAKVQAERATRAESNSRELNTVTHDSARNTPKPNGHERD